MFARAPAIRRRSSLPPFTRRYNLTLSIMTADEFRSLALAFPGAVESAHMNHPDFRVSGKIFATLGPGEKWGMVKLSPDQQRVYMQKEPGVFSPSSGAWGRGGATQVRLQTATEAVVEPALIAAFENVKTIAKKKRTTR